MPLFNADHHEPGVLSKMEAKAKGSGTVQVLVLRFESADGTEQSLLDEIGEAIPHLEDVPDYFTQNPTPWKVLSLELAHVVDVELVTSAPGVDPVQVVTFRAHLVGLKVARSYKKGVDVYTYTLTLEKPLEPDVDRQLVHFVNTKAPNPRTGRPELVVWPWQVKAVEPVAQSVNTDEGQE